MVPVRLLKRLSLEQIRSMIPAKKRLDKTAKLERARKKLLRQLKTIDKKIASLEKAGAAGPGRPRKKKRTMSAAAKRKIGTAKKKWWAEHRRKKNKSKRTAKAAVRAKKAPVTSPSAGQTS